MIIIFDKKTKKLVSFAGRVLDCGKWREPTLEELYPNKNPEDFSAWGFVCIKDSPKYALSPNLDRWQLKLDENGVPIGVERKPNPLKIHLITTAIDTDGDAIPELIADGKDKAIITIEVINSRDEIVKKDFNIALKTTGGTLSARRVTAKEGQATVELTSSVETVSVTVSAVAEGVKSDSISLEFMPPES
ncbi:MAG: hypothetical protein F6K50_19790 [Moorea sp. SIO3I7]|uniref:Ig-like domain-containing protein n=1 Tax=unclassified Moorena TaxID=2683338 RepID=UPI0013C0AC34|nr:MULTISPECIES: Ig-like domain-containing protein [unclassified Moorena]NEN97686.1 hypothetical protein [Moorena sp. SIO3I7]NEO08106.1 hypothetical protein [Moorena sp. SIO3I8]NEP23529.1 hypothetical protein [Moorena sp. SIO3I6]